MKGFCQKSPDRPRARGQEDSPPHSCQRTRWASQDRAKSPETPSSSPQAGQPQDPAQEHWSAPQAGGAIPGSGHPDLYALVAPG